jgi:hypothetical protein
LALFANHTPIPSLLFLNMSPPVPAQDHVFNEAYSGSRSPLSPAQFLFSWWNATDSLAGYAQQDAHEFYLALIAAAGNSAATAGRRQPGSLGASSPAGAGSDPGAGRGGLAMEEDSADRSGLGRCGCVRIKFALFV